MKVEEDLTFLTMLGSKNDNDNSSSNNIASVNNGNGALKTCQESNGTSTNVPITNEEKKAVKKEKVYLTKIFAAFTLFFYIVTRISLQSFCDFDETTDSYIVPYTPSEPTIVIAEIDAITADSPTRESTVLQTHTNMSHVQGTSSQPSSSSSLSSSAVDIYRKRTSFDDMSNTMCHSSYHILDYMALIIHPYVDYNTILPKSIKRLPAITASTDNPSISASSRSTAIPNALITPGDTKGQDSIRRGHRLLRNPIQILIEYCQSMFQKVTNFFGLKKSDSSTKKNQNSTNGDGSQCRVKETGSNKSTGSGDDDWTFYVSVPPELDLSSQETDILQKTGHNFLERLKKDQEQQQEEGEYDQKLENVFWGGKSTNGRFASFPWWFPKGRIIGTTNDDESSGERLLVSYLKIMKWPKNLITKFPFSHLCSDGCPTDFALAHTLEYREKYKPWAITPGGVKENEIGWFYVRGYSPTRYLLSNEEGGSSVIWYRPGLQKISSGRYEEYFRVVIHGLDTCIADALHRSNGKIGKCNVLLDAKGFGLSYIPSIGQTKKLMSMLQDHFPDRLGVLVIANMARAAETFLKMVLPFLPIEVRRKIHLLPPEGEERMKMLASLVEEDFIPTWLGGKDTYTFDSTEYYKTGKYKSEFISDEEGLEYLKTMPYHA